MNHKVLAQVNARVPFVCERNLLLKDHVCKGRITREHALYYAGKKIDEYFAIVLLCAWAHEVDEWQDAGTMDKRIAVWIALNRMSAADRGRYPKTNWIQKRDHLNRIFGVPKLSTSPGLR